MKITSGWNFFSADFSMVASKRGITGIVMLVREPAMVARWHEIVDAMSEDEKENNTPSLYVVGRGETLESAIEAANVAASKEGAIL